MCHHSGDVLSSSHEHLKPSNLFLRPATQALALSFITGIGPAPAHPTWNGIGSLYGKGDTAEPNGGLWKPVQSLLDCPSSTWRRRWLVRGSGYCSTHQWAVGAGTQATWKPQTTAVVSTTAVGARTAVGVLQ